MPTKVLPLAYVRIMGEPAYTEQDSPLAFAVAQFVFAEPGPGGQLRLYTRFGCAAKVRNVLAFAADGAVKVRSALFTVTPSPADRHPAVPSRPDAQPAKVKVVPVATSEFPPPMADGSLLNTRLLSDTVTVPVDPVRTVPTTLAEAFDAKSKPQAKSVAGANALRKGPRVGILLTISIVLFIDSSSGIDSPGQTANARGNRGNLSIF
jgi:hypothetical protein